MTTRLGTGPNSLLSGLLGLGLFASVACGDSSSEAGGGGAGGDDTSTGGTPATTGGGGSGGEATGAGGVGGSGGTSTLPTDTEGDGDFEVGPDYMTDPDLTDLGAPQGMSFSFQMSSTDSLIFKGDDATLNPENQHPFTRDVYVHIPASYQDGDEAPLLVIQDGPGPLDLVSRALDNLTISSDPARRLPTFVAIAVQNGGGDSKGSERGLEYDTMSDRYARFIESEVLPAVRDNAEIKAAFPNFKLTSNPEGKAALGCSSGGAAVLTMGWFRPDLFARLITYSGTFVDQQDDDAAEEAMFPLGAWEYHSGLKLIENTEPKPLRIFLHVSENDNGAGAPEDGHHNWPMANQRTAAALKAQDYHYRYIFAKGAGHCDGNVFKQTLADTLVWTWRGWPVE
ncbi:MAG: enterobactin esterase [Polyangiaceae bacterium]|nr:enterobactin esterase [Polyangiaceae bacterium]